MWIPCFSRQMTHSERRGLIDRACEMSMVHQCRALGISRRCAYAAPRQASQADLRLMRQIDELHTEEPTHGARRIRATLEHEGVRVCRGRVGRLMKLMGIRALSPKPAASAPAKGHRVCPYLLRGIDITRANQVWSADITYIPMSGGYMYLVAVMDWATRFVLSWRLSNCMASRFCLDALDEALQGRPAPGIFNTDQDSQFTSDAFTGAVLASGARMSMDGVGRWRDNVVIERFWRSLKQEAVYLHDLTDGVVAQQVIGDWITRYNYRRPHSALGYDTPAMSHKGAAWPGLKAA